jgi:hypothetical protein
MRWRLEFYHQRRGLLAHYSVEAPLPAAAGLAGWYAGRAGQPPGPAPRRPRGPSASEGSTAAAGSCIESRTTTGPHHLASRRWTRL